MADEHVHQESPATARLLVPRSWLLVCGLTLAVTALNTCKPLHIDDTYFYYQAKHIAAHPLDPLDVEIFWFQWPRLATESTVPPVVPYWLAAGIRLFGENPFLWKLWFSPFVFVFVGCVSALVNRFAPRLKTGLTVMIVLSPAFLPSWDLMLDMPALTLTLASLVLFMRACEERPAAWVIGAGLAAGFAMQTKYTGAIAPVVLLAYAAVYGRMGLGLIATALAATVFGVWECVLFFLYGHSQFIWSLKYSFPEAWGKFVLAKGLVMTLGGTSVCAVWIAMVGLRLPRRLILVSIGLVSAGYALVMFTAAEGEVFGIFGVVVGAGTLAACWRLLRFQTGPAGKAGARGARRAERFLILWLAVEIAGYFFISPFCAVRRILGVVLVMMLIVGRLASLSWRPGEKMPLVRAIVVLGTVLGFAYSALDIREARVVQSAALDAARWIHGKDAEARIWYVGHWGFAYYADQAGMQPVVPDNSLLRRGDWLVAPNRIERQAIVYENGRLAFLHINTYDDAFRVRSVPYFYTGIVPVGHRKDPRLEVYLFRVLSDHVPRTAWRPLRVAEWARKRKAMTWSLSALPYLRKALRYSSDANGRSQIAEAIEALEKRAGER